MPCVHMKGNQGKQQCVPHQPPRQGSAWERASCSIHQVNSEERGAHSWRAGENTHSYSLPFYTRLLGHLGLQHCGGFSTKTICIHSDSSPVSNKITGRRDLLQIRKLKVRQVKWLLAPKPAVPSSRCPCFLLCHSHSRDSRAAVTGERDQSPRQLDAPGES